MNAADFPIAMLGSETQRASARMTRLLEPRAASTIGLASVFDRSAVSAVPNQAVRPLVDDAGLP